MPKTEVVKSYHVVEADAMAAVNLERLMQAEVDLIAVDSKTGGLVGGLYGLGLGSPPRHPPSLAHTCRTPWLPALPSSPLWHLLAQLVAMCVCILRCAMVRKID